MKLSVIIPVYNHEKYIVRAISSVINQHVNFEYEVLIADDCSTDHSASVLKQIEKDYPANFHFIYRDKNYGPQKNFDDLYSRMKGQYFIILEGDDYWIDENKLQYQVDFLDAHPDYIACSHKSIIVNQNGDVINMHYPEPNHSEYSFEDYENGLLPGQTTSIMSRNYFMISTIDTSLLSYPYYAGDRRRAFMMLNNGKIFHSDKIMSAYRYVTTSGSSFSANITETEKTHQQDFDFANACLQYSKKLQNKAGIRAAEIMCLVSEYGLLRYSSKKAITPFLKKMMLSNNRAYIIKWIIKYVLRKRNTSHAVK